MSHDPEAVEALAASKACRRIGGGGGGRADPIDYASAMRDLDALAAAGYTVTRDRYEPAAGGYVFAGNGRWMWTRGAPPNEPLYRKIEGSTDGADRD